MRGVGRGMDRERKYKGRRRRRRRRRRRVHLTRTIVLSQDRMTALILWALELSKHKAWIQGPSRDSGYIEKARSNRAVLKMTGLAC